MEHAVKQMTPGQALRYGETAAEAVHGAVPPLSAEVMQGVLECRDTPTCLVAVARLGGAEALRRLSTVPPAADATPTNPYRIMNPTRGNPANWQMLGWEDQLTTLTKTFPRLDPTGLREMATGYLEQKDIWEATFEREGYSEPHRLYNGLLVFALPGKLAAHRRWNNLWRDVAKGTSGEGLWGRLCEEVLFPQFTQRFPSFNNYRAGQMGSDRFLPTDSTTEWLQELEAKTPGDFACCPANLGTRLAGYSTLASRWEVEQGILDGYLSPTWVGGQYLLCDPACITSDSLWLDLPGDRYRFEDSHEFGGAPCVYRCADGLHFDADGVGYPNGDYGTVFVSR